MKILIPGGTGQIGQILARALSERDHEVVLLSRTRQSLPWKTVIWDARTHGAWADELRDTDVLINLVGRSVNCRYTASHRREIMDSRVDSTRAIARALAGCASPPKLWLQSSTATIYAHRYDAPNDDIQGIIGGDEKNAPDTWKFSIDVAKAWENAAQTTVQLPTTRLVLLRSAMVMSPDPGGVFDVLLRLVKRGLGGQAGDGRQFVSWIHHDDFVRALIWIIEHPELSGAMNLCAPQPLPNHEFMAALRRAARMPVGLPAHELMLEIGALFMQTESELLLKSRRVVPRRLLESGFRFGYSQWPAAAQQLCQAWDTLNPSTTPKLRAPRLRLPFVKP